MPFLLAFLLSLYQAPLLYPTSEIAASISTGAPNGASCEWGQQPDTSGPWSFCYPTDRPGYHQCDWTPTSDLAPTRWTAACSYGRGWPSSNIAYSCDVDIYVRWSQWACVSLMTNRRWTGRL